MLTKTNPGNILHILMTRLACTPTCKNPPPASFHHAGQVDLLN